MNLLNIVTGRIGHWNKTENALLDEMVQRAKTLLDDPYRNWIIAFLCAADGWFERLFLEGVPLDLRPRLKSLTKESFRALHATLLCHHVAVCRDQLGLEESWLVTLLCRVLPTTHMTVLRRLDGYKNLDNFSIGVHLSQEIARVLGTSEMDPITTMVWAKSAAAIAGIASGTAGAVAVLFPGGSDTSCGKDEGSDDD